MKADGNFVEVRANPKSPTASTISKKNIEVAFIMCKSNPRPGKYQRDRIKAIGQSQADNLVALGAFRPAKKVHVPRPRHATSTPARAA